jgi:hypothetical protein
VKEPAKVKTKPAAKKAANTPTRRAAMRLFDEHIKPLVKGWHGKFFLPAWNALSERLLTPAANSAIGKTAIKTATGLFDKYVRPITLEKYNAYVKPERRKLFRNALIAWAVLVSAILFDWPGALDAAVEKMLATDFTGTTWRIESEDAGRGVFVRLAPQGAVEYNSLEAANHVSLSGAEWTRLGRNGLEIRIDAQRFTAFSPEKEKRTKLELRNSGYGSYGQSSGGNWFLVPANGGGPAAAAPRVDADREQLQALVGTRDRPAIHFVRHLEIPVAGHVFTERCREMTQLLQRKELYMLWSIIRVKGSAGDQQPYLMWRDTVDGQPSRITVGEEAGNIPAEVANAASLAPGDPVLGKALTRLGVSCGLGASPVSGNGHLHIPVLALVVPEGQEEPKFSELKNAFQDLVAKLAQGRNQAVGDVLVLNVPPREEGGAGAGAARYTDLEGFARMGATEVRVAPVRVEPARKRIIRKLER